MQQLPLALAPLSAYRQFIAYRVEPSTKRPGKTDKFPLNIQTGWKHDPTDPTIHVDFATAAAWVATKGLGYGVGFVFTENDPYYFLDIDGAYAEPGGWNELSSKLCSQFDGAAVEVSQSGTGLHIIGRYAGTEPVHACKPPASMHLDIELYTDGRFCALTGVHARGSVDHDSTPALYRVITEYFPASRSAALSDDWWSTEPVAEWVGPADDEELLARAMRSQSAAGAFGGKASFADLFLADVDRLEANYPDDKGTQGRAWDGNSVDAALAQHLAFWTGNNADRMLRIMERSALVRGKWERPDYLPRTIRRACGLQREWYAEKPSQLQLDMAAREAQMVTEARAETAAAWSLPVAHPVAGSTYLDGPSQLALFKGCVYVGDAHRILTPSGYLLEQGQFNAHYGGYTFVMDNENSRTTRKAWECFTESQAYRFPRAEGVCFKPQMPAGAITVEGGRLRANKYVPVQVPRVVGDPSPFLDHVARMLPDRLDQVKLLAYMAACVQYQGTKFQWAPLVQGCEGNGKTLLAICVSRAIGARYVHWPLTSDLGNNFNMWLQDNIFYAVDEVFVPEHQQATRDALWQMITGSEGIQLTGKGKDQTAGDICGNFFLLSNYKNATRKTSNDRRIGTFITAQQSKAEMIEQGMDEAYFKRLVHWLKEEHGYAIVAEYMHTCEIPAEHDPRYAVRAPETSTQAEAITASLGRVEVAILEAINEGGVPGLMGGWVSSKALRSLIESLRVPIASNKYREIMQSIGYDYHPALTDGRTNALVTPDNAKPRLFVQVGGELSKIEGAKAAAEAYSAAQVIGATG
jgi:hypothetical protein